MLKIIIYAVVGVLLLSWAIKKIIKSVKSAKDGTESDE